MYLKESSLYVSGLVKMASSCSKRIGLSYMDAECFSVLGFKKSFSSMYDVDDFEYEESSFSLEGFFKSIFGDSYGLVDGLCHWLRIYAGDFKKVYTVSNKFREKFGDNNKERIPFYCLDDIYFVEFKRMIICLLIGNDE